MEVAVLTIDQRGSRREPDRVEDALEILSGVGLLRAFERTAGDEFQGVTDDPAAVTEVVEVLLRGDRWNIGIGFGAVEDPLPASARSGRGQAYLRARAAVTAAKSSPWHICVAGDDPGARALEGALWLWAALLSRRTRGGWEVAALVEEGLSFDQVAARLGVTPSAISQRAQKAGLVEGRRARELITHLGSRLLPAGVAA